MKLIYSGNNAKLLAAVQDANRVLADPAFFNKVAAMPQFAYSTCDGAQVAAEMQGITQAILVDTYRNLFSRATARTKIEININTAKLNRPNASIVNTLVHESVHFVDWAINGQWDYTDQNIFEVPPASAPYMIGALAESMAT